MDTTIDLSEAVVDFLVPCDITLILQVLILDKAGRV